MCGCAVLLFDDVDLVPRALVDEGPEHLDEEPHDPVAANDVQPVQALGVVVLSNTHTRGDNLRL